LLPCDKNNCHDSQIRSRPRGESENGNLSGLVLAKDIAASVPTLNLLTELTPASLSRSVRIMPHTQADLRKAHHGVRKLLREIARLRRQRKDIRRRKRQGGSVTIEMLRHVLKEAVEHRRRIRAQLARSQASNAELAPTTFEPQVLISEPMGEFALAADIGDG
jgi:hypothetical protein